MLSQVWSRSTVLLLLFFCDWILSSMMALWPLTFVWMWLPFDLDVMSSSCQRQVLYHTTLVVYMSNLGSWGGCFFFPAREKEPPSWDVYLPLQTMDDGNVGGSVSEDAQTRLGICLPSNRWSSVIKIFPGTPWFCVPSWAFLYSHTRLLHLSENAVTDILVSKLQQRAPLVSSYRQTHQTCSHSFINGSQGKCKDYLHNTPLLNQLLSV